MNMNEAPKDGTAIFVSIKDDAAVRHQLEKEIVVMWGKWMQPQTFEETFGWRHIARDGYFLIDENIIEGWRRIK